MTDLAVPPVDFSDTPRGKGRSRWPHALLGLDSMTTILTSGGGGVMLAGFLRGARPNCPRPTPRPPDHS
jgi:hypothetical protein